MAELNPRSDRLYLVYCIFPRPVYAFPECGDFGFKGYKRGYLVQLKRRSGTTYHDPEDFCYGFLRPVD